MNNRPSLERVTFRGKCPACGQGDVFSGLLTMHPACPVCGLNISAREQGDGPAFFAIVIIGALATIAAALVEIAYQPPYWLHAAIWGPFVIIGSLLVLRLAKGCMLGLQYGACPDDFTSPD